MDKRDAVPSWDGEAAGWNTYVRRVRLQWERTPNRKKKLLGAELASRLTGRAWDVSGDLDHSQLQTRNGPVYLLEYLEHRLGRTPIPDLGSRLEEFLVKLRRQPGTRMVQWAADLRESYRRLQRALARARGGRPVSPKRRAAKAASTPTSSQLPIDRRRSDATAEPEPMDADQEIDDGQALDPPVANERSTGSRAKSRAGDGGWTAEEWEEWWNSSRTWSPGRRRWRGDDSSDDDGPEPEWERFQLEEIDVLPPEVLGWLLLRRAHLPAHARLAVLAATNRLELDLVEKAMRDQGCSSPMIGVDPAGATGSSRAASGAC